MKLGKYSAIALAVGLSAVTGFGCNNKAADPLAKLPPPTVATPQVPASVPPDRMSEVQGQMEISRERSEAIARMMIEKAKNKKN